MIAVSDLGSVEQVKPRLRGVLHEWAFYLAIPLGISVGLLADTALGKVAAAVFAGAVVVMFGASALYHRVNWSPSLASLVAPGRPRQHLRDDRGLLHPVRSSRALG